MVSNGAEKVNHFPIECDWVKLHDLYHKERGVRERERERVQGVRVLGC